MITIDEIMTTKPHTLSEKHSMQDAIRLMAEKHIRHIPVVNAESELVGLVTHRDVLAATDSNIRAGNERQDPASVPLSKIMIADVATVDEHVDLRSAARFLQDHKYGCLPVVVKGKLKGIVTASDFVTVAINLLEQLEEKEFDPSEDFDATDLPGETDSPEDY